MWNSWYPYEVYKNWYEIYHINGVEKRLPIKLQWKGKREIRKSSTNKNLWNWSCNIDWTVSYHWSVSFTLSLPVYAGEPIVWIDTMAFSCSYSIGLHFYVNNITRVYLKNCSHSSVKCIVVVIIYYCFECSALFLPSLSLSPFSRFTLCAIVAPEFCSFLCTT